jgi:adenosylcobinamide-phosphate synthase
VSRNLAIAVALGADRLFGEPPASSHPVAGFGTAMGHLERCCYAQARRQGVAYAAAGVAAGVTAGRVARSTALATYIAVGGRALRDAALAVDAALGAGDLDGARRLLPALVGRDPTMLDEKEICRAVVESVAENTVDAVVAPALWAAVGAAPCALGYRAVNTMDAMVGHRSDRYREFGWAAARLDDAANWVPARVTAALVAAARPSRAAAVMQTVRRDAPAHPSPNAGVAEAAFAAALGLRLGGENRYGDRVELRPPLGAGRPPERDDIARAVRLSRDTGSLLAAVLLAHAATAGWWRRARRAAR